MKYKLIEKGVNDVNEKIFWLIIENTKESKIIELTKKEVVEFAKKLFIETQEL